MTYQNGTFQRLRQQYLTKCASITQMAVDVHPEKDNKVIVTVHCLIVLKALQIIPLELDKTRN